MFRKHSMYIIPIEEGQIPNGNVRELPQKTTYLQRLKLLQIQSLEKKTLIEKHKIQKRTSFNTSIRSKKDIKITKIGSTNRKNSSSLIKNIYIVSPVVNK